ncbi:MAG: XRE family transcriptional regulator [Actinomycetota bacterium]|nr:XRE family transcriptional regulator [Actinomycetota bacterium]
MNGPLSDTGLEDAGALVGAALRAERERAGLSMRALAALAGVSQPFLSQVERGVTSPSIATLYRLADALDLSPAELLPSPQRHAAVRVVRAHEGRRWPVSEQPNAAEALVTVTDGRLSEMYRYELRPEHDLGGHFASDSEMLLYVESGRLRVDLRGVGVEELGAGDAIFHPGAVPHRWEVVGDETVRALLVVSNAPVDERLPTRRPVD